MPISFEEALMTGAAVALQLSVRRPCWPRNLQLLLMTRSTARIPPVVAWIAITVAGVTGSMRVCHRRPLRCRSMTGDAIPPGNQMWPWCVYLTGRYITVVTRHAIAGYALVIKYAAHEGCGGMAVAAIQGGRNVWGAGPGQFGILAGCRDTVTRVAPCRGGHVTMIEHCIGEGAGSRVTGAAIRSGSRVRCWPTWVIHFTGG